jgi:hypothetical protein
MSESTRELVGLNGFGLIVRGDSMAARNIRDGDVVWVNPDRQPEPGEVVAARKLDEQGSDCGMVVRTHSATNGCCPYEVVGTVMLVERVFLTHDTLEESC